MQKDPFTHVEVPAGRLQGLVDEATEQLRPKPDSAQYPTLDAALEYARLGYRVIPLKAGTKVPDLRHWPEEASSNPRVVERHFRESERRSPGFPNVGIVTGNGLAVLDVDSNHGGNIESLPDVARIAANTLQARTPSGGTHYYFAVDRAVPNSVGRLAPGIDVRGERGQVGAPPSRVRSQEGKQVSYEWLNDQPIQFIRAELLIPLDEIQDYEGRRRRFEFEDSVPVGRRNNYLTSMAGYLFAQGDAAEDVLFQIRLEAERLHFSPSRGELEAIVRSVGRYH
jgi:hypothetical protein